MAVKGLSSSGAEAILTEWDRGENFLSLDDFIQRVKLGRDDIIALCPAGAFDSISGGLTRSLQARHLLGANQGKLKKGQNELFAAEASPVFRIIRKNNIAPQVMKVQKTDHDLWEEYRALGFLRNVHPLALWKKNVLALKYRVKALHIENYVGRNVKMVGCP